MSEHQPTRCCMKCGTWYAVELAQCPNPKCGYVYERDRAPKAVAPDERNEDMA